MHVSQSETPEISFFFTPQMTPKTDLAFNVPHRRFLQNMIWWAFCDIYHINIGIIIFIPQRKNTPITSRHLSQTPKIASVDWKFQIHLQSRDFYPNIRTITFFTSSTRALYVPIITDNIYQWGLPRNKVWFYDAFTKLIYKLQIIDVKIMTVKYDTVPGILSLISWQVVK